MKRLSTSLLIFILALLALPERAWAWTSVEFRGSFDNWTEGHTMTENSENSFTYEFDASADFTFKFYVSDNNGLWLGSYDTNSQTVSNYDGTVTYWCSNRSGNKDITFKVDQRYKKYKIDLLWNKEEGGNHYFTYTVTGITEGGSSDPVSKYKLMMGDGTNEGSPVAKFTGAGFPYTATYNIDAAGTYYFYVNDGSKDYLNADKAFSDGTKIRLYQYGTSNYRHAIKLEATTTGTYTFTFAQETSDYFITCTYPTSTGPTPTPTPILGNNFYLVGDFLNTDKSINYDCRYFKLSETAATVARDGVEEYSINIPTTLAVNVQILATDEDGSTALYGPDGVVTINKNNPSGSSSTTGTLVAASKTLTNYFKFEDRTTDRTTETPDANDGLYTITVTVTNGVPTNYTITHNPLTRVAYYLPNTSDASVKESLNSRSGETEAFNNVFFGRVYLPAGVACYVLSNYLGNYDYEAKTDTKTKLYLQGNTSGGNPDAGADRDTKVYPIKTDNGTATGAKPFIFSTTEIVAMNLEYNPRRGHGSYIAEGITGEVLRSQKTTHAEDGSSITVPTITELRMVGPAVGDDTWNYNNGYVMNYNMAEQCWEATINTSAKAGAKFRFVANNTWENSWQENGTAEADKARIPYNVDGKGHAATPADPNEVSYISLNKDQVRDENYDIIFNRDPGTWRVRFYFTSQQIDENNYKYIFKYTINGYKSVLRTYCSSVAQKPKADSNIKVYGAYAFEGDPDKKSGKIKLYEMNYIPANEGVILYSSNTIDEETIETVMEPYNLNEGKTKYKNNILDANYHNYLVGTLKDTTVNASVFNANNVRTHRNFFFNYFSKSGCYTDGATDYLGFFRIKSGSTCIANHAYLSLPTDILAWNGQTFGQVMDQYETTGEVASLKNGMRIIFSDGSDWVEDVPTSITTIKDKNRVFDNYYYTLQGVRVEKPLKGIYIHNGKKVVIK